MSLTRYVILVNKILHYKVIKLYKYMKYKKYTQIFISNKFHVQHIYIKNVTIAISFPGPTDLQRKM